MISDLPPAALPAAAPLTHVRNSFAFDIAAPLGRVAPLFGPAGERVWAGPHWNPSFLYPAPGQDIEGAVFTVPHGATASIWVNTVFDLAGGRMQYVCMLPDILVATVDVRLHATAAGTHVDVTYSRTALRAEANGTVAGLGEKDRASGPEWQSAVSAALQSAQ